MSFKELQGLIAIIVQEYTNWSHGIHNNKIYDSNTEIKDALCELIEKSIGYEKVKKPDELLIKMARDDIVEIMIEFNQIMLIGLQGETFDKMIKHRLSIDMQVLAFFYPVLFYDSEFNQHVEKMLEKNLRLSCEPAKQFKLLQNTLVAKVCTYLLAPNQARYESPVEFINHWQTRQQQEFPLAKIDELVNKKLLAAAWRPIQQWARQLGNKIKPDVPWSQCLATNAILGLLWKFGLITKNQAIAGLIFFNLLYISYYAYKWYNSGLKNFSKAQIEEAYLTVYGNTKLEVVPIYNTVKQQEELLIINAVNLGKDNTVLMFDFAMGRDEGLSFFAYARQQGYTIEQTKALRAESAAATAAMEQKAAADSAGAQEVIPKSTTEIIFSWFGGKLHSDMLNVNPTNVSNCLLLVDEANIRLQAKKAYVGGKETDDLIKVGKEKTVFTKTGPGIEELAQPIPGTAMIDGVKVNVLFTHKLRDPDYGNRIYCYQEIKLAGKGGPTLLVACILRDDHGKERKVKELHAPNLITTNLIKSPTIKVEEKAEKEKEKVKDYNIEQQRKLSY